MVEATFAEFLKRGREKFTGATKRDLEISNNGYEFRYKEGPLKYVLACLTHNNIIIYNEAVYSSQFKIYEATSVNAPVDKSLSINKMDLYSKVWHSRN
jgi:hypothetical protein